MLGSQLTQVLDMSTPVQKCFSCLIFCYLLNCLFYFSPGRNLTVTLTPRMIVLAGFLLAALVFHGFSYGNTLEC